MQLAIPGIIIGTRMAFEIIQVKYKRTFENFIITVIERIKTGEINHLSAAFFNTIIFAIDSNIDEFEKLPVEERDCIMIAMGALELLSAIREDPSGVKLKDDIEELFHNSALQYLADEANRSATQMTALA